MEVASWDLRDRGAHLGAQAAALGWAFPSLVLLVLACAGCGEKPPPPPAAPHDAPARDLVVRTGRFAIHANAYVDYYAGLRADALSVPDANVSASMATLDEPLIAKLGNCSDDACASAAMGATSSVGLAVFLKEKWPDHAYEARRTLGLNGGALLDFEDPLGTALATQIGRTWPEEPIALFLTRVEHDTGSFPRALDGPFLDIRGGCFEEHMFLECLFTRALDVLLPDSDLGRGIAEARAGLDEEGRRATEGATACVAALAASAAVAATDRRYQPSARFHEACSPALRHGLEDAWRKRMTNEVDAKTFGVDLVRRAAGKRG